MKKFLFILYLLALAFFILGIHSISSIITPSAYAEEPIKIKEVVVTATKIEEPLEETISDVIVIKSEEIKEMNVEFVTDVLKDVSEVNLVQNGGVGKQATVILRGGDSTHILVMIDGVKVKSTTTGSFDFSGISVDDIERIEIIKGPQSTIYGSEAMAGVINIITRKGRGKPKVEASLEGGSYGTYKSSLTVSGGDKKIDYRLTGTYFYTNGISVSREGIERDGYKNASLSGKFGLRPTEKLELEISGKYYYDRSELDFGNYGRDIDASNYTQYGHHYMLSGKGMLYLSDTWEQILTISTVKDSLKDRNPDATSDDSDVITGMNTIEWQHNFYLSNLYIFTLGTEYREEKGENIKGGIDEKIVDNKALYLNNKLKLLNGDFIINAGLRYDDHETFGSETTYRIGGIYNIKPAMLKVKSSYGTGFRAPTLNELFYEGVMGSGDPNLKPEKSNSWEIGIEKDIVKDRAFVSITYFDQNYKDLIDWIETPPGSWRYSPQNIAEAEIKGIEAGASMSLTDCLMISSSYTYLDTKDKETGERLSRRPKDKLSITTGYLNGPITMRLGYTFVGKVYDSSAQQHLGSYSLVNISGGYRITDNIKLFARIDNLLDEDYEVAEGYSTPGFSSFAGIRFEM
jgi:vitamin B12 transporter